MGGSASDALRRRIDTPAWPMHCGEANWG